MMSYYIFCPAIEQMKGLMSVVSTPSLRLENPRYVPESRRNVDCSHVQVGGSLFQWLYEYLHRLESGVYMVQPIDLTTPSLIPAPTAGNFLEISLFPVKQQDTFIQITDSGDTVVSGHASSSETAMATDLQTDATFSKTITNGIELTATAIFVPHNSSKRFVFVY